MTFLQIDGIFRRKGGVFIIGDCPDCCQPCDYIPCFNGPIGDCPCCNYNCGDSYKLTVKWNCCFANWTKTISPVCSSESTGGGTVQHLDYSELSGVMDGDVGGGCILPFTYNFGIGCSAQIDDGDCDSPYGWSAFFNGFAECPTTGLSIWSANMTLVNVTIECGVKVKWNCLLSVEPIPFNLSADPCCDGNGNSPLCVDIPMMIEMDWL